MTETLVGDVAEGDPPDSGEFLLSHYIRSEGDRESFRLCMGEETEPFFRVHPELREELAVILRSTEFKGLTSEEVDRRYMEVASHLMADWHRRVEKYFSGICPDCRKGIPMFYWNGAEQRGDEDPFDVYTCPACHKTHAEGTIKKVSSDVAALAAVG